MKNSHTLLNKCDKFALTEHVVDRTKYYKIDLNLRHRYWTDESTLAEYDTILDSENRHLKFSWKYNNEEEARAKYTWAVMKWDSKGDQYKFKKCLKN